MGAPRVMLVAGTAVLVAVLSVARPDPANARTPTETRAAAAAARVEQLTAAYREHSAAAGKAASELAQAYAAVAAAEEVADRSVRGAARARTERAARTLALYAFGVGARSELSLLTAQTPEDGLWQLAIGVPVAERVLAGSGAAERAAETRAAATGETATAAQQAAAGLSRALARLREEKAAAHAALDGAREELRRLDEAARSERAAREAAARLARTEAAERAAGLDPNTAVTALAIPAEFAETYRDAATTCPGLDWTLLAAVGQIESGHGRNNGPSVAGAIGPMQFMPATFAAYGVDGDRDGTKDAWDPQDAVFSAARYLCASGADTGRDGVRRALLAYNHAQWYVDLVLSAQQAVRARHPA